MSPPPGRALSDDDATVAADWLAAHRCPSGAVPEPAQSGHGIGRTRPMTTKAALLTGSDSHALHGSPSSLSAIRPHPSQRAQFVISAVLPVRGRGDSLRRSEAHARASSRRLVDLPRTSRGQRRRAADRRAASCNRGMRRETDRRDHGCCGRASATAGHIQAGRGTAHPRTSSQGQRSLGHP
jgi:hypothetical protein